MALIWGLRNIGDVLARLERRAAELKARAEAVGAWAAARHAALLEYEIRALRKVLHRLPPEIAEEKVRLLQVELDWIEREL